MTSVVPAGRPSVARDFNPGRGGGDLNPRREDGGDLNPGRGGGDLNPRRAGGDLNPGRKGGAPNPGRAGGAPVPQPGVETPGYRRPSLRDYLVGFVLWFAAVAAFAQPAPVAVTLTPTTLTVGDPVEATLAVQVQTAELTGDPRFPVWGKRWGEAEVLKAGTPVKVSERDGKARWEQRVTVTAFRPGRVALPPVEVAVPFKTRTVKVRTAEGLALEVRSVLPKDQPDPEPKPAAPPVSLPLGERFWWTAAGLGALCLALGWLLFRRRAAETAAAAPALAPFAELAASLDRLAAEPSELALHTGLSLAMRRYLARRLPFPALESTTSDIQRQLLSRRVPGPLARRTVELLRACDLVKFARQPAGEAQARERLEVARKLAHEYEAYLAPREERLEAAG